MKKGKIRWLILLGIVLLGALSYFQFGHKQQDYDKMPKANIITQTKSVNGFKFTLRNAKFSEDKLMVGYEVEGGSLDINDFVCVFYENGVLIDESTNGEQLKLGENHYYLTAKIDETKNLPRNFNLTIEIKARSIPIKKHDTSVKFDVELNRS